jgi:hypothetical protein
MKLSARIEPFGREAGLLAYECPQCGAVTSELIEPSNDNRWRRN